MANRPLLAVRADGGPGIGSGHLSRMLALVQAWTDRHGEAVLVSSQVPEAWASWFARERCAVVSPRQVPAAPDWWVVDGYRLGGDQMGPPMARKLRVDDADSSRTGGAGADLVLDQNAGARAADYPAVPASAVMCGPEWMLFRRELIEAARELAVMPELVVVAPGGSPTPSVDRLFSDAADLLRRDQQLSRVVRRLSGGEDVVPVMVRGRVGLVAAGVTAWELCLFGVPLVVVAVAPNQAPVARAIVTAGAGIEASPDARAMAEATRSLVADPDRCVAMAQAGRHLVGTLGPGRVVTRMRAQMLSVRPAKAEDAPKVHRWNDDPVTRASSFSTAPIPWREHLSWFAERLADPATSMLIAADGDGDVGLVRFSGVTSRTAEIGVTVAPERRGRGLGAALVRAGCDHVAAISGVTAVVAQIKRDNVRSRAVFRDAGFEEEGSDLEVVRYRLRMGEEPGRHV